MFVIESAIHQAAEHMGVDPSVIQEKNLLNHGDTFPYGMTYKSNTARMCWDKAHTLYEVENTAQKINTFNKKNAQFKQGMALMPICFGISW